MNNLASKKYNYTYQTKNLINNKTYIGVHSTNNLNDGYLGSGDKISFSIKKYGKENFKMEILCFFDTKEEAYEEERFLIDTNWVLDRNNYNVTLGGYIPPSFLGKSVSDEAKRKISIKNTGKIRSPETRKLISEVQKGRKITNPETLAKMSASMKGKNRGPKSPETIAKQKATKKLNPYIITEETRKKLSIAGKGRKAKPESIKKLIETRKSKSLPIHVYSVLDNRFLGTFYSCLDIARTFGVSKSTVDRLVNGRAKKGRKYLIKRAA